MDWWLNILPVEIKQKEAIEISYHNKKKEISGDKRSNIGDQVMLVRSRLSRICSYGNYLIIRLALILKQ